MITNHKNQCPDCGGTLKNLGCVKRIIRGKNGDKEWTKVRRFHCSKCGKIHRELPSCLMPYKHYNKEIIQGVVDGTITSYDLDYEDYPCETTIKEWKKLRKKRLL